MTRKYEKREPVDIAPVFIKEGMYLTMSDYAKRIGVTRMTVFLMAKAGKLETISIKAGVAHLVRIPPQ